MATPRSYQAKPYSDQPLLSHLVHHAGLFAVEAFPSVDLVPVLHYLAITGQASTIPSRSQSRLVGTHIAHAVQRADTMKRYLLWNVSQHVHKKTGLRFIQVPNDTECALELLQARAQSASEAHTRHSSDSQSSSALSERPRSVRIANRSTIQKLSISSSR